MPSHPLRVINSVAPIRICDCGGWTDTWFAGHGRVFNIGVTPCVEVQLSVGVPREAQPEPILVNVENTGQEFEPTPDRSHHPLIEATVERMAIPDDVALRINIFSDAPPGASTGTSASLAVALVGALDHLTPGRMSQMEIAKAAFSVETEMLGRQSGIQDQLCAAFGALNFIEMDSFPHARVTRVQTSERFRWELEDRLLLVYLGTSHNSSSVHQSVIRGLEDAGSSANALEVLRTCADQARDAVLSEDFDALGNAMVRNIEAQEQLHSSLVGDDAHALIDLVRQHGALGWKLNGAGGDGGSLTVLTGPSRPMKRALVRAIECASPKFRNIPIALSPLGVRIWDRET